MWPWILAGIASGIATFLVTRKSEALPGPQSPQAKPPVPGAAKSNTGVVKSIADSTSAVTVDHFADAVVVTDAQGVAWLVAPDYIGPVGIGEAAKIAKDAGGELPTPALVDAIWRAADLKLVPMPRNNIVSQAVFDDQKERIRQQIGGRSFTLLSGSFKDVVAQPDGFPGLYGWFVSDEEAPAFKAKYGIPLLNPKTPGPGKIIQPMSGHAHGLFFKDYSQGVRLVKRA